MIDLHTPYGQASLSAPMGMKVLSTHKEINTVNSNAYSFRPRYARNLKMKL